MINISIQITIHDDEITSTQLLLNSKPSITYTIKNSISNPDLEKRIHQWMNDYLEKKKTTVVLPFNWTLIPFFTRQVLQFLQTIPFGSVMSYGEVAKQIGNPKAFRAVGHACGKNPFPLLIPCHRVIASDGSLGGFSAGLPIKKALLSFESGKKM